jgi:uncharacterized protein (TIGR00251 family)
VGNEGWIRGLSPSRNQESSMKETKDGVLLPIKVVPKSSKNALVGGEGAELKIKIKAPPHEGEANKELIRFLSKTWKIPKTLFSIESGLASRHKKVLIQGVSPEKIKTLLSQL